MFSRHAIRTGDNIILVEDVCNNFSTTDKLVSLILSQGGHVIAIVCILNRSTTVEGVFTPSAGPEIPVIAAARKLIDEFHQDDSRVADDILKGNVVWDAKPNWSMLMEVMRANEGR
jgi:orotate phosphoribosyltransferase